MDTDRILNLTKDNKGWLTMTGMAVNRSVYLFGIELASKHKFNWGCSYSETENLALAILENFIPSEEALKLKKPFSDAIIAAIPDGNFNVSINMDMTLRLMRNDRTSSKKVHAHQLIRINYKDFQISKLIHFQSMPYKEAIYKEGTLEHRLLSEMPENHREDMALRLNSETKHMNSKRESVSTRINRDPDGTFIVYGGMGSGTFHGLDLKEYEDLW